jgi:serpin B
MNISSTSANTRKNTMPQPITKGYSSLSLKPVVFQIPGCCTRRGMVHDKIVVSIRTLIPALVVTLVLSLGLFGCSSDSGDSNIADPDQGSKEPASFSIAASDLERELYPEVTDSDYEALLEGNRRFALDLYQQLRGDDTRNLFYSPYSISVALAMTWAGARGNTADEMANVLHFTLEQEEFHPAFNKLDLYLSSLGQETEDEEFILSIENSIWGEKTYTFLDDFLDLLAVNYGAAMNLLDFLYHADESREIINQWIEDQTNGKIEDLLPENTIGPDTALVLTNAVYFYGSWLYQFDEEFTSDGIFNALDGNQVTVPMMEQTEVFRYMSGDGFQAIDLPYEGEETGMLIIVPDEGTFEAFEQTFDTKTLGVVLDGLTSTNVTLYLPKWEFVAECKLKETLKSMGMVDAFTAADFSGIDGTHDLFIDEVFHKAFVAVDESGTEAAAATAVVVAYTSIDPSVPLEIDRPFIFLIMDYETETILFAGRVTNPGAG